MSKFKVGDMVTITKIDEQFYGVKVGTTVRVKKVGFNDFCFDGTEHGGRYASSYITQDQAELVTSNKGATTMKERTKALYRLKKDTLEYKSGTIVKEQCTDGTQDFNVLDAAGDETGQEIKRSLVVDNPTWFEEGKLEFTPLVKRGRPAKRKYVKSGNYQKATKTANGWTPERRAKQARMMKRLHRQGKLRG